MPSDEKNGRRGEFKESPAEKLQTGRVLGLCILGAAIVLSASIVLVALLVTGFPFIPEGSGYLLFLLTVFVLYFAYLRILD
jgi:hypothetical protein